MDDTDNKAHINTLLKKATDAHDAKDAMAFTQAALNAANAISVLAHLPK